MGNSFAKTGHTLADTDRNQIATHLLEYFLTEEETLKPVSPGDSYPDAYKELASRITVTGFENVTNISYLMEYCVGLEFSRGQLDAFIAAFTTDGFPAPIKS